MSEETAPYNQEENDKKWPLWWIVFPILLVLSLCATGYLYSKYYDSTHAADGQSYESIYKDAVAKHSEEKKMLKRELDEIKAKLEEAIQNNASLLANNMDLEAKLDAKTLELLRKIKSGGLGNPKALREAKAEIERLKDLHQMLITKSDSLTASNQELIAKVLETESSAEEARSKATEFEDQKNVLQEKIKNSSLSASDLKVIGMRKKGSAEEETFKAFKTTKLKISFTILANDLVEAGNKEVTVRLIGINNEVLTNNNETLTDTDKLSTMVETIDFQNEAVKATIFYSQKAAFKKGTYSIELIHNEKLMGRASFILR